MAAAAMVALAVGPGPARGDALAGNAAAPLAVGRSLGLSSEGPVAQPVTMPARVSRIAVVPESGGEEAWATGYNRGTRRGWDRLSPDGQPVFLQWRRDRGWRVAGPALDEQGNPALIDMKALALLPSGEGWAVGANGTVVHRAPGGPWSIDPVASRLTSATLLDLELGVDDHGAFGWAVGTGLTVLRLDGQTWSTDQPAGLVPVRGQVPDLGAVTAVDRDRAWAVNANASQLTIYERSGGSWSVRPSGNPMFDAPPSPVTGRGGTGTVNQRTTPRHVDATGTDVWFTGQLSLVDPVRPLGADRQRPFLLHFDVASGRFTSWCSPLRQLSSGGATSTVDVCDRSFPYAVGDDLPFVEVWPGNQVVAAGEGLYRFDGQHWSRQGNVGGYALSASFETPGEGWIAWDGVSLPGTGSIPTSVNRTVAHVTTRPDVVALRRWPVPATETLHAVAADPGSALVVAAGQGGRILHLDPQAGWQPVPSPTAEAIHDIAFTGPGQAWAVGSQGTILRFREGRWELDPSSGTAIDDLYSVAFGPDGRGVAVGAAGAIQRHEPGTGWRPDPASGSATGVDLNEVAHSAGRFVVVGMDATVLAGTGGEWQLVDLRHVLARGPAQEVGNLLAVDELAAGRVMIGGEQGVLFALGPDDEADLEALPPIEGSVHTIEAWAAPDGSPQAVVSVGDRPVRWSNDLRADAHGTVLATDGAFWTDLSHELVKSPDPALDAPVVRDPAFAIHVEGDRGWVVGGFPAPGRSNEGHVRFDATASIWRLALTGQPEGAPGEGTAVLPDDPGMSFAFLASSACATGTCGEATGLGARADVVLTEALRAIDAAAREDMVEFVVHGGDLRRDGQPDDLEAMGDLLDELSVPTFGVVGDHDLYRGIGGQAGSIISSNGYYMEAMADRPGPWGTAAAGSGMRPVQLPGSAQPEPGRARTHYAFDAGHGSRTVRMVVLDTSQLPLASNPQNPSEDQGAWLQQVLLDARTRGIPAIVAMHRPAVLPLDQSVDASVITTALTANGASAVLTSQRPTNLVTATPVPGSPDAVPVGVFGGAGSPLEGGVPIEGAYHSWQLVTVDTRLEARTLTGRSPVTVRSIPVLESVALGAPDGRQVGAGGTLPFTAVGRLPDAGGAHGDSASADPNDGKATYLRFPFAPVCSAGIGARDAAPCRPTGVVVPQHRFVSLDERVGRFVREDPARPGHPLLDAGGRLVADSQSGLFCAFSPGTTTVRVEAGVVARAVPVTVSAGAGPCAGREIVEGERPVTLEAQAVPPEAEAVPSQDDEPRRHQPPLPATPVAGPVGVAVAPPILGNPPAPPGGGAMQKEEERESATEQAHATRAAHPTHTSRPTGSHSPSPVFLAVFVTGAALAGGLVAGQWSRRRRSPAAVVITHKEHP